jgi:hypothetical protein
MSENYRLTDLANQINQVIQEEGDLLLHDKGNVNAHNEKLSKLVNINAEGVKTIYEDTNKE